MLDHIKRLKGSFPTVHLMAVSVCVFIISITLMLLPSEEVSATRSIALDINDTSPHSTESDNTPEQLAITPALLPAAKSVPATTAPAKPVPAPENWVEYEVESGDNLTTLFKKAGLSARDVYTVATAAKPHKTFARMHPGERLAFLIEGGKLEKLRYIQSRLTSTLLIRDEDSFTVEKIERIPEVRQQFTSGTIENSLFVAGEHAGLSNKKIMELASLFGWDVDFVLDIRQGDSFNVMYEEHYLDGEKIDEGPILAAQFTNQGNTFTALRYINQDGDSNYYTPDGYSMRKAFLRSPVDFARISSRFNLKRKHPVLNRIRAHKGVDYAAGSGTPIKSAGDGKIIFRGVKGGYGNVVIVQHGGNITTLYAHMRSFKRGQSVGSRVKQGQVVGFVGSSGLATGPHLHYEFRVNGVHKNPLTVKLPQAEPIPKSERGSFDIAANRLLAQLETYQATQLAQLNQ
ncbi:OapA family protein [Pontibacter sp. JAM-7]|uniref:OapA family protein n=1 Tax=Pontibacter sp. JAM-7 TaxID=3366581 RepID=UPI003AF4FFA8